MTGARRQPSARRATQGEHGTVLVAERDQAACDLIRAFLTGEGYGVTAVFDPRLEAITAIADVWPPDYLLLGGQDEREYGRSWDVAAGMRAGARPVQVVMLTADLAAAAEARSGQTARSRAFAAVLTGPYDLRELLGVLRQHPVLPRRTEQPTTRETQRR